MKPFVTILLVCCYLSAIGNPTYRKLCEINRCWTEQNVQQLQLPKYADISETDWIRLHLSLVEQTLKSKNTSHLTTAQREKRMQALNHLHEYWQAGAFPQNEDHSYRLPIFIDKYDNFCAVGYLVKATGYEHVSRMISAKTNLAYVREMNYPELNTWAKAYGFTTDELAWIQPTYSPQPPFNSVGKIGRGTGGIVNELYVDTAAQKLYVGGVFTTVDSTITANNIAYVTETGSVYTWHALGAGINGTINAIMKYGNNIFAGGQFTTAGGTAANNIAYWDGTGWNAAGCLDGTVKELEVFNNNLYAAGNFKLCSNSSAANFAKWTGSSWQAIPGITGTINTIEVLDTMLLLGGNFTFGSSGANVAKWNPNIGFAAFGNNIPNEVNDFQQFVDTLYAACAAPNDSNLIFRLRGNQWYTIPSRYTSNGIKSVKTLCVQDDTCLFGGNFYQYSTYYSINTGIILPPLHPFAYQTMSVNYFVTDSIVNKMVVFKNSIIAGGMFKSGGGLVTTTGLNGICRRISNLPAARAISVTTDQYSPCRGKTNSAVYAGATGGYWPHKYQWSTGDTTTMLVNVPLGTYTVIVTDRKGFKDTATIILNNEFIDTSLNVTGHTFVSNNNKPDSLQWVDCAKNYTPIPGATDDVFVAPKTGSYALIIRRTRGTDVCIDTSRCYFVVPTLIEEQTIHANLQVFPNPANDVINVISENQLRSVVIIDILGRTINRFKLNTTSSAVEISSLQPGIYTLKATDDAGQSSYTKFIKE